MVERHSVRAEIIGNSVSGGGIQHFQPIRIEEVENSISSLSTLRGRRDSSLEAGCHRPNC